MVQKPGSPDYEERKAQMREQEEGWTLVRNASALNPDWTEPERRFAEVMLTVLEKLKVKVFADPKTDYGRYVSLLGRKIVLPPSPEIWRLTHEFSHAYLDAAGRGSVANEYERLKAALGEMEKTEKGLMADGKSDWLKRAFGVPTVYPLGARGKKINYQSYLGNLVDESRTLGAPELMGHPMENAHEFFASAANTLMLDGEKFFGQLRNLEKEANQNADGRRLLAHVTGVLALVNKMGWEMAGEMRHAAGFGAQNPLLENFQKNLAQLQNWVIEKEKQAAPQMRMGAWQTP